MSIMAIQSAHRDTEFRAAKVDSAETNLAVVAVCAIIAMIVLALVVAADLGGGIFNGILG